MNNKKFIQILCAALIYIIIVTLIIVTFVSTGYAQKSGGGGTPPATPPNFSVSTNVCGPKILTRNGTPPSGVIWYWTDNADPNVATFLGATATCTVNSSHTYYLLPYTTATRTYGTANLANVTVNPYPAVPPTTSVSLQCGVSILTESAPPSGVTFFWQDTNSSGQSTTNSSTTYNAQSSGIYYIGARSSAGCWSANTSIPVTVNLLPSTPPTPLVSTNNCGSKSLSFNGAPPSNVSWYWEQNASGTTSGVITTGTTADHTGTYYLRAKDSNGCWSANSAQVAVTINPIPGAPTIVSSSGNVGTPIPLVAAPGQFADNVNWYNSSTGGTPLVTSTTYGPVLAAPTTFYITSVNNSSGCESTSARTVLNVSVYPAPVIVASAAAIIQGQAITLSVANSYDTYSWKKNNVEFSTTSTTVITTPGTYTITVTKSGLTGSGTSPAFIAAIQYKMNSVIENQLQRSGINSAAAADLLSIGDCQRRVTYAGGLGNVLQTILPQYSPLKKDVIQPVEYTASSLQLKKYLPYVSGDNGGSYRLNSISNAGYTNSDQYNFYQQSTAKIATDTKPYSVTTIEPSPLLRVVSQTGPGSTWHDNQKSDKIVYMLSRASDNIKLWSIDATGMPVSTNVYADYQLSKSISYDENNNTVITYSDSEGHIIQKSQQTSTTEWLQTIYIYNDLNQLLYILQPEGVRNLSGNPLQSFLDTWAFQFHYDELGRKIETKAPGAGWQYIVYDLLNRPVLSQNANQRVSAQWSFIKYDIFGRPVMNGVKSLAGSTRASLQTQVNSQSNQYEVVQNSPTGYTLNMTFPAVAETELLGVNYYDNYDFLTYTGWDAENHTYGFVTELGIVASTTFTSGLPTGSKKRIITSSGTNGAWLNAVQYYNDQYRLIQIITENHKNGLDRNTMLLNSFSGRLEQTLTTEGTSGVTVLKKYGYDHVNRLQKIWQNINNASSDQLVVQYEYNELGQLVDKKLHGNGTNFLQSIDYRYSIRGWLRSINGAQLITNNDNDDSDSSPDYFGMDMMYEASDAQLGNTPTFNGNISAIKFKGPAYGSGMTDQKSNIFTYDKADRVLTNSTKMYGTTGWNKNVGINNETLTYDYNGNIKSLSRSHSLLSMNAGIAITAPELMDNLTYTYASGNQLSKVDDSVPLSVGIGDFKDGTNTTTEYAYDNTGNLISDNNKGISLITYNALNLAQRITFNDGSHVDYTYDGDGIKLVMQTFSATNTLQTSTDYINEFVFVNNSLNYFGSPEGRIVKNNNTYDYQYSISDYQGNTRLVFSSTIPATNTVSAKFETSAESSSFDQYPTGAAISSMYNHTSGGTQSQLLNGGYASMIGVAKSYKVFAGDQLKIEAYARYTAPVTSNSSGLTNFATALLGAFHVATPAVGEKNTAGAALNGVGALAAGGWGDGTTDNTDPKAFVNIILFDKNYNFLDVAFAQVSSTGVFSYLSTSYTVKEAGYAYLYISNEQSVQTDVYFDDVSMTYTPTNILQYNEYYTHGMQNSNSWTRDNNVNNFLYNEGSELNSQTALYDLAYRNYDATLGRFHQVDPLATATLATYQYSDNNPILFNDPLGLDKEEDRYRHDPTQRDRMIYGIDWVIDNVDSHVDLGTLDGFVPDVLEPETQNQLVFIPYGTYGVDPVTGKEIPGTRKIDGYTIVSVESKNQKQGGKLYSNETDAYNFMWNNSFRDGKAWKENFAWITKKGVLVLPITENSKNDESDFSVYQTKTTNGKFYVNYNNSWLQVLAAIHTHPNSANSGLSLGDINNSGQWGVPIFAIGIKRVLVGLGPEGNPNYYNSVITDSKYLLNGSVSVYKDLLPNLPK